ncbi:MAG TPA: presenilin family intramembrane aspartyl protease PSH [Candidatus Thermoplasmatota archaeon]|nr:presenilin family intramembrane aspartyl protease PSH [Candidatus Thermoplasmatota archaeon]
MDPRPADVAQAATAPPTPDPAPGLARDGPAVGAMALLFLGSIGLAMAFSSVFDEPVFEDKESLANPLIYLAIVVVFTVVILLIAKFAKRVIIKYIILGSVLLTIFYVAEPLLELVMPPMAATALAAAIGGLLTALLWWYPEWWVIDATGVLVAAGAAGIFGISFGLLPALLLLAGFAIYDAIAVYRTKHMLDLADSVLELRLPIMFVVPKTRGYSFLEETRRIRPKDEEPAEERKPREAMFMGLGDAVIPGVLVVASLVSLDPAVAAGGLSGAMAVALATLAGSFLGFLVLMWFVLKGQAHAGLPLLNGGAIAGFFLALLPLYGIDPLLVAFRGA